MRRGELILVNPGTGNEDPEEQIQRLTAATRFAYSDGSEI